MNGNAKQMNGNAKQMKVTRVQEYTTTHSI